MKLNFVLAHGFGFCEYYWDNLVKLLPGKILFYDDNLKVEQSEVYIGIGHSLGFVRLNNSGIKFKHIFGLQAFLNFCGNNEKLRKIRLNSLNKMIESFRVNNINALNSFYKTCNYYGKVPENVEITKLIKELESMKYRNVHCGIKTTILGSKDDKIVPFSIIEDNFSKLDNVKVSYINSVGHSLGYRNCDKVARIIKTEINYEM